MLACPLPLAGADDGMPFPGPPIAATTARVAEGELLIANNVIMTAGANYLRQELKLKFDGIGGGMYATGSPSSIAPDLDGLVRVLAELRQANPEVFIHCTVGTWASPYWVWFADSVWRQGEDCAYVGEGNARERWITYRDERIYTRFAQPCPLYPLNSLNEIHGYAAWHPVEGGSVVLRNLTGRRQTFVFNLQVVWELPAGARQTFHLTPALGTTSEVMETSVARPVTLTLKPFEVQVWEASPQ